MERYIRSRALVAASCIVAVLWTTMSWSHSAQAASNAAPTPTPSPHVARPTPTPATIKNHYFSEGASGGALYEIRNKVLYFAFARPEGTVPIVERGYISNYSVRDDRVTDYPSASVMFVTAPNLYPGSLIAVSYPLTINGRRYECATNTSSQYAAMFHVCPTLPQEVLGKSHVVQLEVYRVPYPGGGWISATDNISTIGTSP